MSFGDNSIIVLANSLNLDTLRDIWCNKVPFQFLYTDHTAISRSCFLNKTKNIKKLIEQKTNNPFEMTNSASKSSQLI